MFEHSGAFGLVGAREMRKQEGPDHKSTMRGKGEKYVHYLILYYDFGSYVTTTVAIRGIGQERTAIVITEVLENLVWQCYKSDTVRHSWRA